MWSDVANSRPDGRLRRSDSNSEDAEERARFCRRRASGVKPHAPPDGRGGHLTTTNDARLADALVGNAARYVLPDEDDVAERGRRAVFTARHAWRRAGVLMAAGSCSVDWVAPCLAQKHGVLTHAHHQHDRENSCSKHVRLAIASGKSCAMSGRGETPQRRDTRRVAE